MGTEVGMGRFGTRWDGVRWGGMRRDRMGFGGVGQDEPGRDGIREPWYGGRQQVGPLSQAQEWWDGGDFHLTLMEKMSATKPRQKKLPYRVLKKDQSTKSGGLGTGSC